MSKKGRNRANECLAGLRQPQVAVFKKHWDISTFHHTLLIRIPVEQNFTQVDAVTCQDVTPEVGWDGSSRRNEGNASREWNYASYRSAQDDDVIDWTGGDVNDFGADLSPEASNGKGVVAVKASKCWIRESVLERELDWRQHCQDRVFQDYGAQD